MTKYACDKGLCHFESYGAESRAKMVKMHADGFWKYDAAHYFRLPHGTVCRYKALGNWEAVARSAARWDSLLPCFLDFCSMYARCRRLYRFWHLYFFFRLRPYIGLACGRWGWLDLTYHMEQKTKTMDANCSILQDKTTSICETEILQCLRVSSILFWRLLPGRVHVNCTVKPCGQICKT